MRRRVRFCLTLAPPPKGYVVNFKHNPNRSRVKGMFDLFGYGTPLYGILGTGDAIPAWVWGCACGGILALILAIFLGKRRERTHRT